MRITSPSGLSVDVNANGSLRRFDCESISLGLFFGNEIEAGPGNLFLRRLGDEGAWTALLGPGSPTRFRAPELSGAGEWGELAYSVALVLAAGARAWFWHVHIENRGSRTQQIDLTYAQDLALAPYGAVRLNEFYVSQYLDHMPLKHAGHGTMVASRQNQAAEGRYPWSLLGSLRVGTSFATDALQFYGLTGRAGEAPIGLDGDLPGRRLQHEHAMVVLRDAPMKLDAGSSVSAGFFGFYEADHPDATGDADLDRVAAIFSLPEAAPPAIAAAPHTAPAAATLFSARA